ncbi:hypothetical protein [Pelotomaculum propionicicum]|uniref:HMA domain-containing protein n=1 Tax=Pelotomaculum propionicicum TaxID=258475 RepID=A0A4Y7RQM6_9FIRM|nr:hypothetical protein [Pelotomaculum propionicicum]NLI11804.1 hypothetical protein [Peptococcaceae bacterium]TEB11314.1 hypothetical protein Pmgp_01677 [Pelotomaculum propionicicum]
MSKKISNHLQVMLVIVLSIALLATPAMAGYASAKVLSEKFEDIGSGCAPCTEVANMIQVDPNLKFIFNGKDLKDSKLSDGKIVTEKEFTGRELAYITETALADKQVNALYQNLVERGFVLAKENVIATKITAEFNNSELGELEKIDNTIVNLHLVKNDTNETAIISFVSNKFGTGAAALAKNNDNSKNLLFYDSKADKIVASSSLNCWVCQQIVTLVKNWPQGVSCLIMCGSLCLVFVEYPPAMAACNIICNPVCRYVTKNPNTNAYEACLNLGYCP